MHIINGEEAKTSYGEFGKISNTPDGIRVSFNSRIISCHRATKEGEVLHVQLPRELPVDEVGTVFWPLRNWFPLYGEDLTHRIAQHILHREADSDDTEYGVLPIRLHWEKEKLHIEIILDPEDSRVDCLLFITNKQTYGFAGANRATAFNLGNTGLYGAIVEYGFLLGEISFGNSIKDILHKMAEEFHENVGE